ncbi:MAG: polysaccharide biosynthesis/export family protein [Bacillota bacterium]
MRKIVFPMIILLVFCFAITYAEPGGDGKGEYLLTPGDVIRVTVFGHEELSIDTIIGLDGKISYPFLNSIQAAGQTLLQLQSMIKAGLTAYIRDPVVTLFIMEYHKVRVSVLGQAMKPGIYEIPADCKVTEAIAAAGGPTERADLSRVILQRDGNKERLNMGWGYHFHGEIKDDPVVLEGDRIIVGETWVPDWNKMLQIVMIFYYINEMGK